MTIPSRCIRRDDPRHVCNCDCDGYARRIAELEAEVERLRAHINLADGNGLNLAELLDLYWGRKEMAERKALELKAGLATERAKSCETCRHWESTQTPPEEPPSDFYCNRFEPRQ